MDRYTLIDSPELDEVLAGTSTSDAFLRRTALADAAWAAYQDRPAGDARGLADFQREAIDQLLAETLRSRVRNEVGRARIALSTVPTLGPLDHDDPASLEAYGFPFQARTLRQDRASAEHSARVRRVDAAVASEERLHANLRRINGADYADRFMAGDDAA